MINDSLIISIEPTCYIQHFYMYDTDVVLIIIIMITIFIRYFVYIAAYYYDRLFLLINRHSYSSTAQLVVYRRYSLSAYLLYL